MADQLECVSIHDRGIRQTWHAGRKNGERMTWNESG